MSGLLACHSGPLTRMTSSGHSLLNKIGELLQVKRLAARVHKGLDVVLEHPGSSLLGMLMASIQAAELVGA